jgi:hypothetical protein
MSRRLSLAVLLVAASAAAQRPVFDPDDFVDPQQHDRSVFITRLVAGAARNYVDGDRPLGQDAGFIHLTNTLYWKRWQFDYKHSEVRGDSDPPPLFRCGCSPPQYFPTPPPSNATPSPPRPGSRDTVQAGWYLISRRGALRYRLTFARQGIDTAIRSAATQQVVERRSGREQSFSLDADLHPRGTLVYTRTSRRGTPDDRAQQALTYTARAPGWAIGPVLTRAALTAGGVTKRGGTALNVVNPAFEAFFHSHATRVNLHLVWSPLATRDGVEGWRTRHQIAVFADRALWVHVFKRRD